MAQNKSSKTSSAKKKKTAGGSKTPANNNAAIRRRNSRILYTVVFFLLGVFTFIGYFDSQAVVIKFLRNGLCGLFGTGFYVLPPALFFCSFVFLFSKERPRAFRIICIILIPIFVGIFAQLLAGKDYKPLDNGIFPLLWEDGKALIGGGAVGGYLAIGLEGLISVPGTWVVSVLAAAVVLVIASGISVVNVLEDIKKRREIRAEYRQEDREEDERLRRERLQREQEAREKRETAYRQRMEENSRERQNRARRSVIDIPVDGDDVVVEDKIDEPQPQPKKKVGKTPLFNSKPNKLSPDQLFSDNANAEPVQPPQTKLEPVDAPPEPKDDPQPQPEDTTDSVIISPAVYDAIAKAKAREKKKAEEPKPEIVREEITPEIIEPKKPEPKSEPPKEQAKEKSFEELISENAKRDLAEANHEYRFPPIELLEAPRGGSGGDGAAELDATRNRLELILQSFGINAHISNIINGPSVTRYEMELEIGVKLNKLTSLADDIALALGVGGVRIAAIPNKISTVGIEVPNKHTSTVYLREIISSPTFQNAKSKLTFALGKNIGGEVMVGNINKLPHLLIAGTTGSGKSVSLNSLILSLMYKATPDEVKFIMIDPKMVEFKIYNGIPHLLVPVVTEAKKAAGALQWAVTEMMKRYRLFSEVGARDIAGYNEHLKAQGESPIPFVVVIIDELADLMLVAAKEVEESICRVAQMGRAAGVHLVIATQSPRADVITGLMKANIPSRISFKVASSLESRIILDAGGAADKLMGNGDMLYAPIGTSKPVRIQGSWVSDEEREKIVDFVKQSCTAEYSEDVIYEIEKAAEDKSSGGKPSAQEEPKGKEYDELLPQAVDVIFETQQASVSMLQRRLKLGYARAARLVDQMEEIGVVGPFEGSKPRQILVTRQQWSEMQFLNGTAPLEKPADNDTMTSADDLFDDNTGEEEDL